MDKEKKAKVEIEKINSKIEKLKGRIYEISREIPIEEYRVMHHMYEYKEDYSNGVSVFIYQIAFNKELPDTGAFKMMTEGLNEGLRRREKRDAKNNFRMIPSIIKRWIKSLTK